MCPQYNWRLPQPLNDLFPLLNYEENKSPGAPQTALSSHQASGCEEQGGFQLKYQAAASNSPTIDPRKERYNASSRRV